MSSAHPPHHLHWLSPGEPFPCVDLAWGPDSPYPGLLCAGGVLDIPSLTQAYAQGIFPWFSTGQPVLWWSTAPRLVLQPNRFELHRSLRKTIESGLTQGRLVVRFDHATPQVIEACAETPRAGQSGTWIVPAMIKAYQAWHQVGGVHSAETWWDGELVGGLYAVQLGRMVFGESMFSRRSNASKIALAALVAWSLKHHIPLIDCQQATSHLISLGAHSMERPDFLAHVHQAVQSPPPPWVFSPDDWSFLY